LATPSADERYKESSTVFRTGFSADQTQAGKMPALRGIQVASCPPSGTAGRRCRGAGILPAS
jgi:hypothetical protein